MKSQFGGKIRFTKAWRCNFYFVVKGEPNKISQKSKAQFKLTVVLLFCNTFIKNISINLFGPSEL